MSKKKIAIVHPNYHKKGGGALTFSSQLKKIFDRSEINLIRVGRLIDTGTYIEEDGEKREFRAPQKDELWKFIKKFTKNS